LKKGEKFLKIVVDILGSMRYYNVRVVEAATKKPRHHEPKAPLAQLVEQ
jgi:hypothetical protein